MKRAKTLRKLPPKTREIAKLLNELESVSKRLSNRLDAMAKLEDQSVAFEAINRMKPEERGKSLLKLVKSYSCPGCTTQTCDKCAETEEG